MSGAAPSGAVDAIVPDGVVHLTADDLPVYCPNPSMPLWSSHPRVFLDIADNGAAMCPYCGTRYKLDGAARPGTH